MKIRKQKTFSGMEKEIKLNTVWERFCYIIRERKYKRCRSCCIFCEYYDVCKAE